LKLKSIILFLLIIAFVVAAAGCSDSNNKSNESQAASTPVQAAGSPSADQDAQWVSLMQNQSAIIQTDLKAISDTQTPNAKDPFDAEKLSQTGQQLADDANTAIAENDNYTVSDALNESKTYWGKALENYSLGGQLTIIGAEDYKKGDKDSSLGNLGKAGKLIKSANSDALLAKQALNKSNISS
jgi:hypothetical protein